MVAAVGGTANPLASAQSQPKSSTQSQSASAKAFQQSLDSYLQNTSSGAGGAIGANASPLSSDLMSTLMQMQG